MLATRSLLYIPASKRDWVESMPEKTEADGIIFELEDGIAPKDKDKARQILRESLDQFDAVNTVITARVNHPSTGMFEEDIDNVVHPNLDAIVLPKVGSSSYVQYADNVLTYVENRRGIEDPINLFLLPETSYGLYDPYELCNASDRVASITGATTDDGDFNRALGYEWTREGLESLFARSNVIAGAKAANLDQILSGIWTDLDDLDGLREHAEFGRQLGFTGYEIIHPDHAKVVNDVFTPDKEEIEWLQNMIEAVEDAWDEGEGVIEYDGMMVDMAHIRTARQKIERAKQLGVVSEN